MYSGGWCRGVTGSGLTGPLPDLSMPSVWVSLAATFIPLYTGTNVVMVMRSSCVKRMDGILALVADIRTKRSSYAYFKSHFCTTVQGGPSDWFCSGLLPTSPSDNIDLFKVFFYPIIQWKERKWRPNGSATKPESNPLFRQIAKDNNVSYKQGGFCHRNCIKMLLLSHKKHIYT